MEISNTYQIMKNLNEYYTTIYSKETLLIKNEYAYARVVEIN
jgi:hypothetical protein